MITNVGFMEQTKPNDLLNYKPKNNSSPHFLRDAAQFFMENSPTRLKIEQLTKQDSND